MLANFFRLPGEPVSIDGDEFLKLTDAGGEIRGIVYEPPTLVGPSFPRRERIENCHFIEVSLSKTSIERFEFINCTFNSCLFIGTIFRECRFSECKFIDCNTHRIEFVDVFVSPLAFASSLDRRRHQNIGVHLYQELLNNSRRQSQPDFAQDALFEFRRWLRFEKKYLMSQPGVPLRSRCRLGFQVLLSWMADILFGYGIHFGSYLRTASILALFLAWMNWYFISAFGLKIDQHSSHKFVDAFYFTIITLTTVGYGDITPQSLLGRLIISGEAVAGFFLLAVLASMIYRKMQP